MHWCSSSRFPGWSRLLVTIISIQVFTQLTTGAAERQIFGVIDCDFISGLYTDTGALLTPQHGAVHIMPSDTEPALRIQIIGRYDDTVSPPKSTYWLDVLDMGMSTKLPGSSTQFGTQRILTQHGTTSLTNKELFDADNNGRGVLRDLWTNKNLGFSARYAWGKSSCMPFAKALTTPAGPLGPNVKSSGDFEALFKNYQAYIAQQVFKPMGINDCGMRSRSLPSFKGGPKSTIEFPIKSAMTDVILDPIDTTPTYQPTQDRIDDGAHDGANNRVIQTPDQEGQVDVRAYRITDTGTVDGSKVTTKEVIVTRNSGVAAQVVSVAKEAVRAAGVAGLVIGAAFVILDFVNHNWVGAAIGLAGEAAGLAVIGFGGPVGWIVGGLITAFFAILPSLFKKQVKQPDKGNIAQAIQFAMFGDASTTGNEQCRKDQSPNCTALYGPGVIALSFKWDYFDAVAFLISSNNGFPMSIVDMADHIKSDGTAGANATLKCSLPPPGPANAFSPSFDKPDTTSCLKPVFLWHGDLVTLPNLNDTAVNIKKRLIDSQGNGDCKMDDPSNEKTSFDTYGFSVTGLPVSVACNITAGTNLNGVVIPLEKPDAGGSSASQTSGNATASSTNSSIPVVLPGSDSTNGQNGAYIAPPANPPPFKTPFNSSNTICFTSSGSSDTVCLPSGTYAPQQGTFGLKTSSLTAITVPGGGCSIKLDHTVTYGGRYPGSKVVPLWQNDSISDVQGNKDLKEAFSQMDIPANKGRTFTLTIPDSAPKLPPAAGFFGASGYLGDVFWLSEGGGNFTDAQTKATKSVKLVGGATAYIFAGEGYGDKSEQRIQGDVQDLSGVKLADGDFSGKVKAAWIVSGGALGGGQNHKRKKRRMSYLEDGGDVLTIDG